jgi:hypothetical protein
MKSFRIATDSPVEVSPNEVGTERRLTNTHKGRVSHKDLLTEFRKKSAPRTIHSDGFLCVSEFAETAYSCPECGFQGIFKRPDCIRCGAKV